MVDPASIKREWKVFNKSRIIDKLTFNVQEIFSTVDVDQSGTITCNELYKFIVRVNKIENNGELKKEVDWDEVKAIFKGLDKDGSRSVDWEEFFEVVSNKDKDQKWRNLCEKSAKRKQESKISEEEVKSIFFSIDKDKNGEISQKEAMRACRRTSVMGKLGIEDVEEWLKLTDKDGVCNSLNFLDTVFNQIFLQNGTINYEEFKFAFVGTNLLEC